jgi:hypothetical protein
MELSGSERIGDYTSYDFYIVWSATQNIANNTSTVTARLEVRKMASNSATYDAGNETCRIKIDGDSTKTSTYSWDMRYDSVGSIETIVSDTYTVTHNSNGTLTTTIYAFYHNDTSIGDIEGTIDITLNTIPRASVLSNISSFNIEDGVTIAYTAYASFTEKLDIYLGATAIRTGYELASGSKVEFTDDEILKFYKYISDLAATVTFNLKTYSGSTQIGSTSTKTATGTIAGFLRRGVGGVIKRCVIYKEAGGSIKKCIPYIGVGGSVKRGIY